MNIFLNELSSLRRGFRLKDCIIIEEWSRSISFSDNCNVLPSNSNNLAQNVVSIYPLGPQKNNTVWIQLLDFSAGLGIQKLFIDRFLDKIGTKKSGILNFDVNFLRFQK